MLISQSWKETGNRKQEAGKKSIFLSPFSCLLSPIGDTATLRGNKSVPLYLNPERAWLKEFLSLQ